MQSSSEPEATLSDCETSREAIAKGQELFAAGKYEQAQSFFEQALELPGTGVKRFRCAAARSGHKRSFQGLTKY